MNPTRFAADAGTSARQPALPKSPPNAPPVNKHRVLPGVVSGLCTAALFNPWDRALFLSVVHKRVFLSVENFRTPFQGLAQTLVHRTVSNGLYFALQDAAYDLASAVSQRPRTDTRVVFSAGLLAGAVNGAILNSIAAVKYQGASCFSISELRLSDSNELEEEQKQAGALRLRRASNFRLHPLRAECMPEAAWRRFSRARRPRWPAMPPLASRTSC